MITILYNAEKQKYAVYDENGKKILISNYGINPNDAIKAFGITSNTFVETEILGEFPETPWGPKNIHELSSVTITETKKEAQPINLDEIIDSVSFDTPGKDKLAYVLQRIGIDKVDDDLEEHAVIDWPGIGKKLFVDENTGILRSNSGGIATVKMAYLTGNEISVGHSAEEFLSENPSHDIDEDHLEHEEESDEEEMYTGGSYEKEDNILVEFEELPGQYFSYPILKRKQDVLKNKFAGLKAKPLEVA